jgi:hypothetical protein
MDTRLIATAAVTAALASVLSVGVAHLSVTGTAQAAPSTSTPSETQLLTEIVDNTSTANDKLHVLGEDLKSILSEDEKVYSISYLSAKRLRYINTNLLALDHDLKSDFTYRNPYHTKYTVNELTLLESTLCDVVFWTQDDATGSGSPELPPGSRRRPTGYAHA